jgi:putative metallohydrolase (TIGR04338 family)
MYDEKARVYKAENVIAAVLARGGVFDFHGSTLALPPEYRFSSLEHVQMYVNRVLAFGPVIDRFGKLLPVQVVPYRGFRHAEYRAPNQIAIPVKDALWAMRELVVCHEIAHHIDYHCYHTAGHGPTFRTALIDLVRMVIAPEAALLLQTEFSDSGLSLAMAC